MRTFLATLVVSSDLTWDSDDEACSQIGAAVRHHLRAAHIDVVGSVVVQPITDGDLPPLQLRRIK